MPMADNPAAQAKLLRTLIIGREKTKKTWWALKCAELGYNVILFDGDDGSHIVNQMPAEAKKKILVVDCIDNDQAVFAALVAMFLRPKNKFAWDEQDKVAVLGKRKPEHSFIEFDAAKLTPNDVVIFDSWTALSASSFLSFANEQKIDVTEADKTEWDGYGFQGRFLDFVLTYIHKLPCHVIIIGHIYTYDKFKGQGKDRVLVSSTIQPISSSGAHGQKIGKHFSDVLFFKQLSQTGFKIDTSGDANRAGGSRLIPPGLYDWEQFGPAKLFEAVHSTATGAPCLGAKWIAPGESQVGAEQVKPQIGIIKAAEPEKPAAVERPPIEVGKGTSVLSRLGAGGVK